MMRAGPFGLVAPGEQVVGTLERHEAPGVPRGPEDLARVRDAHRVVGRGVHDQEGSAQRADLLTQVGRAHVLDEVPPQGERLAADQERRLAVGEDPLHEDVVVVLDVAGIVRRPDARHGAHRVDLVRRGDDRRPAEGVPHQEPHLAAGLVHEPHRLRGVGDLVGERPVAPVALGVAEPEVVEAQHPDALARQLLADPAGGRAVLAQREAVGEHAPSPGRALGVVDQPGKPRSARAGEPDPLAHVGILPDRGGTGRTCLRRWNRCAAGRRGNFRECPTSASAVPSQ